MKKDFVNFVGAVADLIEMFDFDKPKKPLNPNSIWLKKAKKTDFPDINALKK